MNHNAHPNLFRNKKEIIEPNQDFYKSDYLSELFKEQQQMNDSLNRSLKAFKISFQKHQYKDDNRWRDVTSRLQELNSSSLEHKKFESQAREWLNMLENNNQQLQDIIKNESVMKQEMKEEIQSISKSNDDIASQLAIYENANAQLTSKIEELVKLNQSMSEQLTVQNDKQETVITNLKNQEAILEKSYRQLSNLRSILYERTGFVADKIEESFNITSSVLYKLLTGTDKPLTLMMMNQKKEGSKPSDE